MTYDALYRIVDRPEGAPTLTHQMKMWSATAVAACVCPAVLPWSCLVCPLPLWLSQYLCLVIPLHSWLRQCRCLVFPLPSWLRQCLCRVFPLPSWLRQCLCPVFRRAYAELALSLVVGNLGGSILGPQPFPVLLICCTPSPSSRHFDRDDEGVTAK